MLTRFPIAIATISAVNLVVGISVVKAEPISHYEQLHALLFSGARTTAIGIVNLRKWAGQGSHF